MKRGSEIDFFLFLIKNFYFYNFFGVVCWTIFLCFGVLKNEMKVKNLLMD